MKKIIMISVIFIIINVVFLTGCNTNNSNNNTNNTNNNDNNNTSIISKDKFVGTWLKDTSNPSKGYLKFFSNSTYTSSSTSGTWSIKDGKLVLEFTYQGDEGNTPYDYTFSNNYKTLTLIAVGKDTKTVLYKQ